MRAPYIYKAVTAAAIFSAAITFPDAAHAAGQCTQQIDPNSGLDTCNLSWFSNGLAYYALLASLVGLIVSAALWAMGSKGQNPGTELAGKKGIILCCTAAFFVGALPSMIDYLEDTAQDLDTNGITDGNGGAPATFPPGRNGDDNRQPIRLPTAPTVNDNAPKRNVLPQPTTPPRSGDENRQPMPQAPPPPTTFRRNIPEFSG